MEAHVKKAIEIAKTRMGSLPGAQRQKKYDTLRHLKSTGFNYAVMIVKDVSVIVVGGIVSFNRQQADAKMLCDYLCNIYSSQAENSHAVVSLDDLLEKEEVKPTQSSELVVVETHNKTDIGGNYLEYDLYREGERWGVVCWRSGEADPENAAFMWDVYQKVEGGVEKNGRIIGGIFIPFDEAMAREEFERWRT